MEIFSAKRTCYRRTRYVHCHGYLDKEEINEQLLCIEWFLFGFKIQRFIMSVEEIPMWAIIQLGCFGSTSWKSKNPSRVNKWQKEPIVCKWDI